MMRPDRVSLVVIITGLGVGGAERFFLKILPRLDSRIDVQVISLTTVGPIGEWFIKAGIPVEAIGMRAHPGSLWSFLRLVRRLRVASPDIVQCVLYHADLFGGVAARIAKVRTIVWGVRNSGNSMHALKLGTRLVISLCAWASRRLPDRIICCSEKARSNHILRGYRADLIEVIPNGFDLSELSPNNAYSREIRSQLGLANDVPLIGLIARADPQKDHRGFFEAAGLLHRKRPDVHFVLAGLGASSEDANMLRWAEQAGVAEVTHFLGVRHDIPKVLSALNLLVSTSIGEAFPNVVGEAMACAVPCVVTDVGDSAYIVGDTGLVIPPSDPIAAAVAWQKILDMPDEERWALGSRARVRVESLFELSSITGRYDHLYLQLAGLEKERL
jgi:glycosyltransferase involved in cell wall biosynthesis